MTLEEAKIIAKRVVDNQTSSHVQDAEKLSRFVLGLQSVRSNLPTDVPKTLNGAIIDLDELEAER